MDINLIFILVAVFIIFDLVFLVFVISRKKKGFSTADKHKFVQHWIRITGDADLKRAVMDADKLLDHMLVRKGYSGSMGEKLKKADKLFSDVNGVWSAHKLRNRLAHELEVGLSPREASDAIKNFKRAFSDLGLFD